tara:strand:+ start:1552 stop:2061 length:510 start_codon:yes stop_codon:yes gene_type:complete
MELNFIPVNIFRETPEVIFLDATIKTSNGSDVVMHRGRAISPPDLNGFEQYYVHLHQTDNNLVLEGNRTFTLLNPLWDEPHHIVYLHRFMGALQIPIGTFHRSISGKEGSIVINQAIRDEQFEKSTEFDPISIENSKDLLKAKSEDPIIWLWKDGEIKRIKDSLFLKVA